MNISEGRDRQKLRELADVCADDLLDLHIDPDHNRSVFTLIGVEAPRLLARRAVDCLTLEHHSGVHPRLGVVDVVPFVPLDDSTRRDANLRRDEFAQWAGSELAVPCFVYGDERSLPEVRKQAWKNLLPQFGPQLPHPTAGAMCVGSRDLLVAYNVWLEPGISEVDARRLAQQVRGDGIRTLALKIGEQWQISMNLIEPARVGPAHAVDRLASLAPTTTQLARCELVGLIPESALKQIPVERWGFLDLSTDKTIEYRRRYGYSWDGKN